MTAVKCAVVLAMLVAAARAAPRPEAEGEAETVPASPLDQAQARVDIIMVTQSPAEAIQDAIRYDPDVAAALQSNTTNLYLRKSVTYTNGTAEDLGLPKEELLPGGAPDRVRVADKILYPSLLNGTSSDPTPESGSQSQQEAVGIHATLELVPVPIN